jgi:hypothetical protein
MQSIPRTLLVTTFLSQLLLPSRGFAADPPKCGGTRDSYFGTYTGHQGKEFDPPFSEKDLKMPGVSLIQGVADKGAYMLTVRFYKEGNDYWAESTVKFDKTDTGQKNESEYKDRSGYVLDLTGKTAAVRFTVNESQPVTSRGATTTFTREMRMDARDCAAGSQVPQKLGNDNVKDKTGTPVGKRKMTDRSQLTRSN